jgi:tRNA threonylcarbamoyladenosine biosynthesis protein TsaB
MSNLLSIETSSEACSVALALNGEVFEKFEHEPMQHAELILPMVQMLLAEGELPLGALDAIAFGRGPGSFTSLRIGIGVVQGLAWGADVPVVPVSSLAAVAQEAFGQLTDPRISRIWVAMDARMQEVYSAAFILDENGLAKPASAEVVCPPQAILAQLPAGEYSAICGAGNGFARYPDLDELGAGLGVCLPECWPRAGSISRLAEAWLGHNRPLPAAQAQPVYIRDKVAEKSA